MGTVLFAAAALAMAALVALASRRSAHRPRPARVDDEGGLWSGGWGDVAWPDVQTVTLVTQHHRLARRTRFVFVVECDRRVTMPGRPDEVDQDAVASVVLSSRTGDAQRFLGESYRLSGFCHDQVIEVLSAPRSQSVICYRRA